MLRDAGLLAQWHERAIAAGIAPPGEAGLRQTEALAARCLAKGRSAVKLFVSMVRDGKWEHISSHDEDSAKSHRRKHDSASNAPTIQFEKAGITPRNEF